MSHPITSSESSTSEETRTAMARTRNSITPDSDAALVGAARRGDAEAFEALFKRHAGRILRLAQVITRNHEDAEDVVQDSIHQAFSRLDSFRGDARFSTWLTSIAINQSRMTLRKRKFAALSLDEPVAAGERELPFQVADRSPSPEQRCAQWEVREILRAVIGELRTSQRVVVQLRELQGLSTEETAQTLGTSIASVKAHMVRARSALRRKLTRYSGCRWHPCLRYD